MRILIIEDEKRLADSLKALLESRGFTVETAYDGETGAEYAELGIYDLLILDVMMPGLNGYALARQVRALTKPFDTRELLACIGALLRRQGGQVDTLSFGNTTLDIADGTLACGDEKIRLSAREFDVMRLLMQSGPHNLSKENLLARVWGYDSNAVENHVEVYVGFLRKKLAAIGSDIRIAAIRRLGYHLEVPGGQQPQKK